MSSGRSTGFFLAMLHISSVLATAASPSKLDFGYHNFTQMTNYLKSITDAHPNLTRLYSIGQSVKNRDLWVVKLTSVADSELGVPNVKLIGNIHGDEGVGREVLLHLIEYLATSYTTNDTVQWLLDNTRVYILPSMNPDGFEMSTEGKCSGSPQRGRQNMNNIDLNRNFDDCVIKSTMPAQPEMLAIKQWLVSTQFVLSASLHGGELVANYPYDRDLNGNSGLVYKEYLTPDDDVFKFLAKAYAKTHPTMHIGIMCDRIQKNFKDGITNGAAWYPIKGGMQDYNYCKTGCLELTLEIGCCKYPMAKELPQLWEENREALVQFVIHAHSGVRGIVRRRDNDSPIAKAQLHIVNRTVGFQTNDRGEFWRVLLPGDYQLQVQTDEYESVIPFSVSNITDNKRPAATWLDVLLPHEIHTSISTTDKQAEASIEEVEATATEMTMMPTTTLRTATLSHPILSEPSTQVSGDLAVSSSSVLNAIVVIVYICLLL